MLKIKMRVGDVPKTKIGVVGDVRRIVNIPKVGVGDVYKILCGMYVLKMTKPPKLGTFLSSEVLKFPGLYRSHPPQTAPLHTTLNLRHLPEGGGSK